MAGDAARGKVYTRHARLIQIAAQKGGDPSMNSSLRTAIDNARADNVPMTNIERAIRKGTGEAASERMEEMLFACYATGGVACLVEALSENRNRTLANVKAIIHKHGETFAETNAVLWMFDRKGVIVAKKDSMPNVEDVELQLIDFGAEEIDVMAPGMLSVTTNPGNWPHVRDFLKAQGWEIVSAELAYVPTQKAVLTDAAAAKKLFAFIEALEADDDVSAVHTNVDIPPELAAQVE